VLSRFSDDCDMSDFEMEWSEWSILLSKGEYEGQVRVSNFVE
jgi:hypothetical protein